MDSPQSLLATTQTLRTKHAPAKNARRSFWLWLTCHALVTWLSCSAARAETVSVPAGRDTTLQSENPSWSNGAGDYLFVGVNNRGAIRRALVWFDVAASVPPGSTIKSAELRLQASRGRSGSSRIDVHRVLAAWGEGSSNASGNEGTGVLASDGDATWSHREWPARAWTTPGGDFEPTASATATLRSVGEVHEWSGDALTADVQRWLADGGSNFGWILVAERSGERGAKRFGSRNGSRGARPVLVVEFTPPTAVVGACCSAEGTCGYVLDPGTTCRGTYQGSKTACTADRCPPPKAVCCRPDLSAACSVTSEATCAETKGVFHEQHASCEHNPCPVVLTPFVDPLPLPAVARPMAPSPAGPHYRMSMVELKQKLHRDLPPTTVWGFHDGTLAPGYPGPTIETRANVPIRVTWVNDLRDPSGALRASHVMPVDACPHGATTHAPGSGPHGAATGAARTVVHLHGGHVPSAFDGQPELTLLPGQTTTYDYPNKQGAATLWYHDHALGITRLNVIMGLAGFYIVRDPIDDALPLPKGRYEVPLVVQDRSFHPDGSFKYPATIEEHFFGDTILVNGKVWPYFEVDRGQYRFRLLNGSTSRTYKLVFSPYLPFLQIGSDGGLLRSPIAQDGITIAPGERADVVVDFSEATRSEYVLTNEAQAPYPNGDEMHSVSNVMKFVVTQKVGHRAKVPLDLRTVESLQPKDAVITRDLSLERSTDGCGGGNWRINNLGWHDITERPRLGTTEIWRFINRSGVSHPMHLHLVFFQVLDRQPFVLDGKDVVPTGSPRPAEPTENAWKDTVQVNPFEIVRVIARFEDFAGRFPYHCHILEHEDHEMMRQFETVTATADAGAPDAGGTDGGDAGTWQSNLPDDDGCSCRMGAPASHTRGLAPLALVAVGLGLVRRRRKR